MKRGTFSVPILRISEHFAERATEWIMSGMLLTWGVNCLITSDQVWNDPVYQGIAKMMPKEWFGFLAIAIACGRIIALYINGTRQKSPHARAVFSFLAVFPWFQLLLGFLDSDRAGLGIAVVPWLIAAEVWNVYRAARDARLSDMNFVAIEGIRPSAPSP